MQNRFGVQGPSKLPCLSLRFHIAQKLHGMTVPNKPAHRNNRARDATDVLLFLHEFETTTQLLALREACVAVFESRSRQQWPPIFSPPERWRGEFEPIAIDLDLEQRDFERAAEALRNFFIRIESTTPDVGVDAVKN